MGLVLDFQGMRATGFFQAPPYRRFDILFVKGPGVVSLHCKETSDDEVSNIHLSISCKCLPFTAQHLWFFFPLGQRQFGRPLHVCICMHKLAHRATAVGGRGANQEEAPCV